jgi:hypothetical protein
MPNKDIEEDFLPHPAFGRLRTDDPFFENVHFRLLMKLPNRQRRVLIRQVVLLSAALELDIEGSLELLYAVGKYLNDRGG